MENFYIILFGICLVLIVGITWLTKTKHLREKYALLWFFIALVLIVAFLNQPLVEFISNSVGIKYPPTLVFIVAILGLLLLILMLSVIDSHQTDRIIKLSQRIGILEAKIDNINQNREKES